MRRLLFALILSAPALASAQETYSLVAGAGNVTDLTAIVASQNLTVCRRLSRVTQSPTPAVGCTQAQACTAAAAPGGASCTAAQARAVDARIYPATQAGREEYVTFKIALPSFLKQLQDAGSLHQNVACEFLLSGPGATELAALCSAAGLPAPPACFICK